MFIIPGLLVKLFEKRTQQIRQYSPVIQHLNTEMRACGFNPDEDLYFAPPVLDWFETCWQDQAETHKTIEGAYEFAHRVRQVQPDERSIDVLNAKERCMKTFVQDLMGVITAYCHHIQMNRPQVIVESEAVMGDYRYSESVHISGGHPEINEVFGRVPDFSPVQRTIAFRFEGASGAHIRFVTNTVHRNHFIETNCGQKIPLDVAPTIEIMPYQRDSLNANLISYVEFGLDGHVRDDWENKKLYADALRELGMELIEHYHACPFPPQSDPMEQSL